ncbi:MAG: J domain-containing protein [Paracoccaceae bacterium]
MSGAVETSRHACDWPGCEERGLYRAPHSPDRLDQHRWFCLDHVRRYNASWNFFADVPEEDFEEMMRRASVWERPTWSFREGTRAVPEQGPHMDGNGWSRLGFRDAYEVLGENATLNPPPDGDAPRPRRRLTRREQMALDTLGVPHQVESRAEVRRAYRALVKYLHPVMNGGENAEPERLARVLKAWKVLRKSRNFTD